MSAQYSDAGADYFDEAVTAAVAEIIERRAVIEQAKGMMMLVYGIDATHAFELLREQSQRLNVKLHLIAEQISTELVELSRSTGLDWPARPHR